ncbi:hypothetical protein PCE1_001287 [Barthelona sp. PCE]
MTQIIGDQVGLVRCFNTAEQHLEYTLYEPSLENAVVGVLAFKNEEGTDCFLSMSAGGLFSVQDYASNSILSFSVAMPEGMPFVAFVTLGNPSESVNCTYVAATKQHIVVFDINGDVISTIDVGLPRITSMCRIGTEEVLVCGQGLAVRRINCKTGEIVKVYKPIQKDCYGVKRHNLLHTITAITDDLFIVSHMRGYIWIYNKNDDRPFSSFALSHKRDSTFACFLRMIGEKLFIGTVEGNLRRWNINWDTLPELDSEYSQVERYVERGYRTIAGAIVDVQVSDKKVYALSLDRHLYVYGYDDKMPAYKNYVVGRPTSMACFDTAYFHREEEEKEDMQNEVQKKKQKTEELELLNEEDEAELAFYEQLMGQMANKQ